jgi:hypothetical protein
MPLLDPESRCGDDFQLFVADEKVGLKIWSTQKIFDESEFCAVVVADDDEDVGAVKAEVCRPAVHLDKFKSVKFSFSICQPDLFQKIRGLHRALVNL